MHDERAKGPANQLGAKVALFSSEPHLLTKTDQDNVLVVGFSTQKSLERKRKKKKKNFTSAYDVELND